MGGKMHEIHSQKHLKPAQHHWFAKKIGLRSEIGITAAVPCEG